jgi:2-oxoglutarate ferredoxin oxidoreductase subunit gamma
LAMNQKACDSYCYDLKPSGLIIVDGTLVKDLPTPRAIALPFTQIARQDLGREMVANIVALGALATISGVVAVDSLEKAVLARVPAGTEDLNRRALAAGVAAAEQFLRGRFPQCVAGEKQPPEV